METQILLMVAGRILLVFFRRSGTRLVTGSGWHVI